MRDSRHEAERWFRQAENDLGFARLALREEYHSQACFVAQQTAEKALKAIAYGLGERMVLGHSVLDLLHRISDRVSGAAELREIAGVLDQYYVPTRYPNGLPGGVPFEAFSHEQAASAIAAAERFVTLARQQLIPNAK